MHRASSSDLSRLFRSLDEIGCARSLSPAGCVPLQMQARGAYHSSQLDYVMPFCAGWTDPQTPVHPAVLTSEETLLIEDCRHIVYLSSSRLNEACDVPGKLAANSIPGEEHNHHSVDNTSVGTSIDATRSDVHAVARLPVLKPVVDGAK